MLDIANLDGLLPSMEMTYKELINAVDIFFERMVDGEWSKKESSVYLKLAGLNSCTINLYTKVASHIHEWQMAVLNREDDEETYQDMLTQKQCFPSHFCKPPYPARWLRSNQEL